MIRTPFAALAALLVLVSCQPASQPAKSDVEVFDAWARLPAIADRPGAAYFTVRNNGPDAVITAVQSPRVQRIELHFNHVDDGMTHMVPFPELHVASGETVKLVPGDQHAMLFGVDPQLRAGGALPLIFSLRDGRKVEAQARLVAPGAPSPYAR